MEKCMAMINQGLLKHKLILGVDDRGKLSCHKVNLCFMYFDPADCIVRSPSSSSIWQTRFNQRDQISEKTRNCIGREACRKRWARVRSRVLFADHRRVRGRRGRCGRPQLSSNRQKICKLYTIMPAVGLSINSVLYSGTSRETVPPLFATVGQRLSQEKTRLGGRGPLR